MSSNHDGDRALLEKYFPVLIFSPDERFYPMGVEDYILGSVLFRKRKWLPISHPLQLRFRERRWPRIDDPQQVDRERTLQDRERQMRETSAKHRKGDALYLQYVTRREIKWRPVAWPYSSIQLGLFVFFIGIILETWFGFKSGPWLLSRFAWAPDWFAGAPVIMLLGLVMTLVGSVLGVLFALVNGQLMLFIGPHPSRLDARRAEFETISIFMWLLIALVGSFVVLPSEGYGSYSWSVQTIIRGSISLASIIFFMLMFALRFASDLRSYVSMFLILFGVMAPAVPITVFFLVPGTGTQAGVSINALIETLGFQLMLCLVLIMGLWLRQPPQVRSEDQKEAAGPLTNDSFYIALIVATVASVIFRYLIIWLITGELVRDLRLGIWMVGSTMAVLIVLYGIQLIRDRIILVNGVLAALSGLNDRAADVAATKYTLPEEGSAIPVYGRVFRSDKRKLMVLQYWFFYAFNDWRTRYNGLDDHEGDWEHVDIWLRTDRPEPEPVYTLYSQHILPGAFLRRAWNDPTLHKWPENDEEATNCLVYVAAGSHANYYKSGPHDLDELLRSSKLFQGPYGFLLRSVSAYKEASESTVVVKEASGAYGARKEVIKAQVVEPEAVELEAVEPEEVDNAEVKKYPDSRDILDNAAIPFHGTGGDNGAAVPRVRIGPGHDPEFRNFNWALEIVSDDDPPYWATFAGRWGRKVGYDHESGPRSIISDERQEWIDPVTYAGEPRTPDR